MSKLKDYQPAGYIDSEAVAHASLELARNLGDETILTAAANDVTITRKQWLDHRPGSVNAAAHMTAPFQ